MTVGAGQEQARSQEELCNLRETQTLVAEFSDLSDQKTFLCLQDVS